MTFERKALRVAGAPLMRQAPLYGPVDLCHHTHGHTGYALQTALSAGSVGTQKTHT